MLKKNIPTSSVCSEDYFYDQDGKIENALAKMETMWSKALKNAIDDSCTIDDIESIREFVIYQISRTKAMLSHNREMATSMMKTLTLSMTGLLKELYQNSRSNYEKLQIYRIMFNDNSSNNVIRKFVNETFHIENDYLFQLNPCEFDTVPQYIIDECDKEVLEIL